MFMMFFVCLSSFLLLISQDASAWEGKVVGVADGDTVTVLSKNNDQIRIRLYGIDAPESAQAFGAKAKQSLANMVFGKVVRVEEKDRDRYRRAYSPRLLRLHGAPDPFGLLLLLCRLLRPGSFENQCCRDRVSRFAVAKRFLLDRRPRHLARPEGAFQFGPRPGRRYAHGGSLVVGHAEHAALT